MQNVLEDFNFVAVKLGEDMSINELLCGVPGLIIAIFAIIVLWTIRGIKHDNASPYSKPNTGTIEFIIVVLGVYVMLFIVAFFLRTITPQVISQETVLECIEATESVKVTSIEEGVCIDYHSTYQCLSAQARFTTETGRSGVVVYDTNWCSVEWDGQKKRQ